MRSVLTAGNQFLNCQTDVAGDLSEKRRCNVASFVQRNGRSASISMAVLNVRAALANGGKAETFKNAADLSRFKNGNGTHNQATATFCVPINSASSFGSPSSSSMEMTSRRLALSSSSDSACECAPGNPGTYPTSKPVSGSRSTTAVNDFMASFFHAATISQFNQSESCLNN